MSLLKKRVEKAKARLHKKEVRNVKTKFMDSFGPVSRSEHVRLDNLWSGLITDRAFTQKLEKFEADLNSNR